MIELALIGLKLTTVIITIGMNEAFKRRDKPMVITTIFSFSVCSYGIISIIKEMFCIGL